MAEYYNPDCSPITLEEWSRLIEERDESNEHWWKVGHTRIDNECNVSTVWLGIDHDFSNRGPPLIFETLVFGGPLDGEMHRYSTWSAAEEGHDWMVQRAKHARRLAKQRQARQARVARKTRRRKSDGASPAK